MWYEGNGRAFMHLGLADLYIRRVEEIRNSIWTSLPLLVIAMVWKLTSIANTCPGTVRVRSSISVI